MIKIVNIIISLFEHNEKIHCQSKFLNLIQECCARNHTNTSKVFFLLIDFDIRVTRNNLHVFAHISIERSYHVLIDIMISTMLIRFADEK